MKERFQKFLESVKKIYTKLSPLQKIIIVSLLVLSIVFFVFVSKQAVSPPLEPLYGVDYKISPADMSRITQSLKAMGVSFTQESDQIFVKDAEMAMKLRTQLGIDGLIPAGVKGWELFDNQPFTTTDFERKINVRRAITDNIKKHLEMVDGISSADVVISFGEEKYFADDRAESPLTASIVLNLTPSSDIANNKNKIRGLRDLIARGVDDLKPENVVIMDSTGNVLTKKLEVSDADEAVVLAKDHLQIKEQERMKIYQELKKQLSKVFTEDRFDVKVNLELNWDVEKTKENLILPTVIKQDNPDTPYDDSLVKESLTVSQKNTKETFKGQGYIPEGPAGIEDQVPPGLKEKMDRYNTYEKQEQISNEEFSRAQKEITRQPYTISKITVSVFLDGEWKKELEATGDYITVNGLIKRTFTPVPQNEVQSVQSSVRSLIGFDSHRGDSVSVNAVKFDRSLQFEKEDRGLLIAKQRRMTVVYGIIGVLLTILLLFIYRAIRREMDRRARIREEEMLREQEALRLSSLATEGAGMNLQDKAVFEIQQQVIGYAKDKPEDTAKLLRAWLNSEE